ncbi:MULTISPECIES: hypothetical protein [unclassified Sphingomonas]|uniref:hypothetical protein n=1 Tax=unclassified Sphingomonas TaxID=196159 RepID=UPI002150EC9E|nr:MULTISPECIES: hypothetical protein [unclassified Sphingomonas]MCR5871463.1 hypothetical protein [Sphingomonas sp. J344]UUY00240.1 hypothetical protein LRS08_03705 [Sphingomonas sp. J315]
MNAVRWTLDDAEELAELYPDTFHIAPKETRVRLEPGEYAKAIFRFPSAEIEGGEAVERMWLIIHSNDRGKYRGRLANTPASRPDDARLDHGAWIDFEARHIINWEYASEDSKAAIADPNSDFWTDV